VTAESGVESTHKTNEWVTACHAWVLWGLHVFCFIWCLGMWLFLFIFNGRNNL